MQKEQFDITGMTCSACSTRVEKSVAKLPGIKEVSVNLLKNSMVASYDESVLDTASTIFPMMESILSWGMAHGPLPWQRSSRKRTILSAQRK